MKIVAVVVIVVLAIAAWVMFARRHRSPSATTQVDGAIDATVAAAQHNFLLVVLRRSPADLRPESLEAAAQSAWAGRFGPNEDGSDYVEPGLRLPGKLHVVQAHGNAFIL